MTAQLSSFQSATLREQVRPVGVLLVAVAAARKGVGYDEAGLIAAYIRSTAVRLGYPSDAQAEAELLRYIVNIRVTKPMLRRAAMAVHSDPASCEAFPSLFAAMATIDGPPQGREHKAIQRVRDAIQATIPDAWLRDGNACGC